MAEQQWDRLAAVRPAIARIVARMEEENVAPWQVPFEHGLPRRLINGEPYRGENVWHLELCKQLGGYDSNLWATAGQVKRMGGRIRAGEKPSGSVIWSEKRAGRLSPERRAVAADEPDNTQGGQEEEPDEEPQPKARSYWKVGSHPVYNAEQLEGITLPPPRVRLADPDQEAKEAFARAEAIRTAMVNPPSFQVMGHQPCYVPSLDQVQVPSLADYRSEADWWNSVFHEYSHSTGAEGRLARKGITDGFAYQHHAETRSVEELVAAFGAAIVCEAAGIKSEALHENQAAYCKDWARYLTAHPEAFLLASRQAHKAADLIMGITYEPKADDEAKKSARPPRPAPAPKDRGPELEGTEGQLYYGYDVRKRQLKRLEKELAGDGGLSDVAMAANTRAADELLDRERQATWWIDLERGGDLGPVLAALRRRRDELRSAPLENAA